MVLRPAQKSVQSMVSLPLRFYKAINMVLYTYSRTLASTKTYLQLFELREFVVHEKNFMCFQDEFPLLVQVHAKQVSVLSLAKLAVKNSWSKEGVHEWDGSTRSKEKSWQLYYVCWVFFWANNFGEYDALLKKFVKMLRYLKNAITSLLCNTLANGTYFSIVSF